MTRHRELRYLFFQFSFNVPKTTVFCAEQKILHVCLALCGHLIFLFSLIAYLYNWLWCSRLLNVDHKLDWCCEANALHFT